MRQVYKLLRVIHRADLIAFYNSILSYRTAQVKELPSLTEFLALTLGESTKNSVSSFDEETDKILEAEAMKRLKERQAQYG